VRETNGLPPQVVFLWVVLNDCVLCEPKKHKKAGSSASGEVITSNRAAIEADSHGRSVSRLAGLHASTRFIELLLSLDFFS